MTIVSIVYFIKTNNSPISSPIVSTAVSFCATHIKGFSFAETVNIQQAEQTHFRALKKEKRSLVILLILLASDIKINPGPGNRSVFPCGTCAIQVTWSQEGVCCNNCSVWYHKSCEDLSSKNMSYLGRSSVIWHCCKCNSINIDSFELNTSNVLIPLLDIYTREWHPKKFTNLRLLTVNCCGLRTNKSEFNAALDYIKPDLICGTKSWLRGVKPGKDPEKMPSRLVKFFCPTTQYTEMTDHLTLRVGFLLQQKMGIITDAQPQLTTSCEIVWSKIKTENKNDTYLCSFYMPHRNLTDIHMLDEPIQRVQQSINGKHIILAGDVNCPNIEWENSTVKKGAADRDVQKAQLDLSIEHGLTLVHDQPTRDSNLLGLN